MLRMVSWTFSGVGDGLPDGPGPLVGFGDDFDGSDAADAFVVAGHEAGAGDLAEGDVVDLGAEDAGDADDAEIGEKIELSGPTHDRPAGADGNEHEARNPMRRCAVVLPPQARH